jgi:hypothetical protein
MSNLAPVPNEDDYAASYAEIGKTVEYLRDPKTRELSHAELEVELNERGRELIRTLFQSHIDGRGHGPAAGQVCGADNVVRIKQRLHDRGLSTIFGEVRVNRLGYGADGVDSLHPLDAELNLPVGEYSLGVRRIAAEQAAQVSFDATVEALDERTGKIMGKRQVEELVQFSAVDFDAFYAQRDPDIGESGGSILAISADGKGVVMIPRDLREQTRKAAKEQSHKLDKRLSKGEKKNRKRMATVAAVYTVAPYVRTPEQIVRSMAPVHEAAPARPPVENKRVWASLEKSPEEVIEEAFLEGLRRDPTLQKTWVGLVDGNAQQLKLLKSLSTKHNVKMTIIMDIIHVSEYLWDASTAFNVESSSASERWVTERLQNVLQGNAAQVAAGMRRSATLRGLTDKQREPVDIAARYLRNHKSYMRYNSYLAAGLPIGTGVIEGACRHLVCDRMDGVARWSLKGAESVLRMRALRSSGDFDQYWNYHVKQEYQRNHVASYADEKVMPVLGRSPQSQPNLRLVK